MATRTFWLEPTGVGRLGLRRYSALTGRSAWTCEAGWHDALAWLDESMPVRYTEDGHRASPPARRHDHPAWPIDCERGCGYRFTAEDPWQEWQEPLYRRADTGQLRVLHWTSAPPDAPTAEPGATWDATWLHDVWAGPDGISLIVRLPNTPIHDWQVDGPSRSGGRWTRTGDPRQATVTAQPSIAAGTPGTPGYYHGFLTNGVLTDHIG